MKPYNHVVDAGCPTTKPAAIHLIRLLTVEMRMPVLLTKTCADKLAANGLVVKASDTIEVGKTIKGRTANCMRVSFTPEGRKAALAHWEEKKAASMCTWVLANPGVSLCARKARLLEELGYAKCTCVNPTSVKGEEMPAPKRRYTLALTSKGQELVEA